GTRPDLLRVRGWRVPRVRTAIRGSGGSEFPQLEEQTVDLQLVFGQCRSTCLFGQNQRNHSTRSKIKLGDGRQRRVSGRDRRIEGHEWLGCAFSQDRHYSEAMARQRCEGTHTQLARCALRLCDDIGYASVGQATKIQSITISSLQSWPSDRTDG